MQGSPTPYCIVNGELLAGGQAGFPVSHQSLVDSFGIYETILVQQGRFFHLNSHLHRLGESARILSLDLPASLDEIGQWCRRLMDTVEGRTGLLRIVSYGSDGVHGPVCGLYVKPVPPWPAEAYESGVWLATCQGERTWPLAKSTNCLAQALARFQAKRLGAMEGLIVDRHGHITEGSTCNVLAVRDGILLRPLAGTALEGVTETIALRLATDLAIPVQHAALPVSDLSTWDEAFITSTTRRIMPVRRVDDVTLPASPGPVTARLMAAYRDYESQQGWET
jgi:branched-chain amino acid aminotransferase